MKIPTIYLLNFKRNYQVQKFHLRENQNQLHPNVMFLYLFIFASYFNQNASLIGFLTMIDLQNDYENR